MGAVVAAMPTAVVFSAVGAGAGRSLDCGGLSAGAVVLDAGTSPSVLFLASWPYSTDPQLIVRRGLRLAPITLNEVIDGDAQTFPPRQRADDEDQSRRPDRL